MAIFFMDRHEVENVTAEAVAAAHLEDLKIQSQYDCKAITYWCDESRGTVFCLFEAPSPVRVREMHRAAHGQVPSEVIEVKPSEVLAFLGRVLDPDLPSGQPLSEPAFRALMFTDIANSTGITEALGDELAFGLMQRHHKIVRTALEATGGREVDKAGDGFLASFPSVESAVRCAIKIQKALDTHNAAQSNIPLHVRIGLGAGEPVADGSALFGAVVNQTARICAFAKPGQILTSHVVRELCVGKKIHFQELGTVALRGLAEPIAIDEIRWKQRDCSP